MSGIKIPVQAEFDAADIEQAIQKFTQQVNKMGGAVAQANKLKYSPVDKQTLENMRQLQAQFESLQKISGGFSQRMKATGQSGKGFFDIDWARMYDDPSQRSRQMRKAFEYVASGTGARLVAPGGGGQQPPSQPPPAPPPHPPGGPGSVWGGAGRRIVGAGLNAAGPVGGVANGALSAGMSGGAMAGIAGLAGGLLALGIGKAVGSVLEKTGAAGEEFTQYDTLKRVLGDVNVGFNMLRDTLRASSKELDVTFAEGQKLGLEFAKISGALTDGKGLAQEVAIGGGFSRSFGLDPGVGNSFFAQMRQSQVTGDENDSRRLALMIGEGIGKSGTFSKADEVLQAIGSYTTQQTRLGLVSANAAGYTAMLTGMAGSKIPGLDVAGSANLLSRVNSSIAGGGGAGEAGQNFLYSALGTKLGLNPVQAKMLQEQGAFGTGKDTFGSGSAYALYAEKFGMSTPGSAATSTETNLEMIMKHLNKTYGGNPDLMASAASSLFGVNTSQAMALSLTAPEDLGGIAKRLKNSNIDISSLSSTGISALARINSGGRDILDAQSTSLRGRTGADALNAEERRRLDIAQQGGSDEDLRDILTELTASREQEKTDGSETRRATVGILNLQQELAGKLVPWMNDMRSGILYMAGDKGKMGPVGIQKALMEAESRERKESLSVQYEDKIKTAGDVAGDARKKFQDEWTSVREKMGSLTPEQFAEAQEKLRTLKQEQLDAEKKVRDLVVERADLLEKEDAALKVRLREATANLQSPGSSSTTLPTTTVPGATTADNVTGGPGSGAGSMRGNAWLLKQLAETDKQLGLPPGTSAAQMDQESSWDPNAKSGAGARGLAQVMPETLLALEKRFGRKLNPEDPADAVLIQREVMRENMKKFGNVEDALRAYNGGWNQTRWDNQETRDYVPKIEAKRGLYSQPLPEGETPGGSAAKAETQRISVEGTFNLTNPNGTPAAAPVTINTQVGAPTSFGAN